MNNKPMISYSQNREDVLLRRAFEGKDKGFYVDVGAGTPTVDSVTRYFYDSGWTGINIEPQPDVFAFLESARPKDLNINAAVAIQPGKLELSVFDEAWGNATTEKDVAMKLSNGGQPARAIEVNAKPLDLILIEADVTSVDFIKIDVEGAEEEVLRSVDLKKWRPKVLVVEATHPNSTEPSYESWEPIILSAGYDFVFFDGLNRYYVLEVLEDIKQRLSLPANVFDSYVPFIWWHQISREKQATFIEKQSRKGRDMKLFTIYMEEQDQIDAEFQYARAHS